MQKNARLMEAERRSRRTKTFSERQCGAAVTQSLKHVTGAFTSYGAGGEEGKQEGPAGKML